MRAVWRLTYEAYVGRGLCGPNSERLLRHHSQLDGIPQTKVVLVEDEQGLAGTISVTEDGRCGLHVDATFPAMTWAVRRACGEDGLRLGASWRVITRLDVRPQGRVLSVLIGAALRDMLTRRLDVTLYSFHPRHERVHRKLLGLETIDRIDRDWTVAGAPAVLMFGRLEVMEKKWKH